MLSEQALGTSTTPRQVLALKYSEQRQKYREGAPVVGRRPLGPHRPRSNLLKARFTVGEL